MDVSGAATIRGNLTVDTNTLFVDAASNRVGIGMNNPSAALHLASGQFFIGQPRITIIEDRKSQGTGGGTGTNGNTTRVLNTLIRNDIGVTLTNGTTGTNGNNTNFQIPAGTYSIYAACPAFLMTRNRIRLVNTSNSTTTLLGQTSRNGSNSMNINATLYGVITLADNTTFRIDHFASGVTVTGDGKNLGMETNQSGFEEVYSQVIITQFSS